jgi:hypothetical protein
MCPNSLLVGSDHFHVRKHTHDYGTIGQWCVISMMKRTGVSSRPPSQGSESSASRLAIYPTRFGRLVRSDGAEACRYLLSTKQSSSISKHLPCLVVSCAFGVGKRWCFPGYCGRRTSRLPNQGCISMHGLAAYVPMAAK